tara:strand:- start:1961 stop:5785 length:3825 start_codon:yes stop_codon:yes gene_type:complete
MTMKRINNQKMTPQYKVWQRITAFIMLFVFAFQTTSVAIAATLSTADIKLDLDSSPEFYKRANSSYQYVAATEILDQVPLGIYTIKDFYKNLQANYIEALGNPIYVPISVGDITTVIPIYEDWDSVGSPFVQSRYIRNQIHQYLGRHLINADDPAYRTEAVQLATLYSNAFIFARDYSKRYGEVLGFDTENSGFPNMVWPELRMINGKQVLVPIVYLNSQTIDDFKVDGHEVEFNGNTVFGTISIEGVDVKLGRNAFLRAVDDLTLTNSSVASASDIKLVAGGTVNILSSLVNGNGDVIIAGQKVNIETLVHRYDLGHEHGTRFGEIAEISALGDVNVRSYSDIAVLGANISAGIGINFGADGNIYLGALQDTSGEDISGKWRGSKSSVEYLQTHLTAEENISLMAGGGIMIDAAEIVSVNGHIEILAALGITIEDELGQYSENRKGKFGKKKVTESVYQTVAIRSLLDAGKGIKLNSDFGDITLKAVDITSTEGTQVKASNGAVNLLLTKETDHYAYSSVKKGLFTVKTKNKGHNIETPVYNTIVGGFDVEALKGVNVEYEGLKGQDCAAFNDENGIEPQVFTDPDGFTQVEDECLRANIHKISTMPGMSWLLDVLNAADANPDRSAFKWDEIAFQHKTWSESNTSLSPAFMAVISIAVALAAGPVGAGLASSITGVSSATILAGTAGFTATAISAGTAALISQGAVALGNGIVNGDIGGAMEDFASDDTLKSLATSMVTAGVISELNVAFFDLDTVQTNAVNDLLAQGPATPDMIQAAKVAATQSLNRQVVQVVTHAAVKSGTSFLVNGGNLDDLENVFVASIGSTVVSTFGESGANAIRDADFNTLSKYLAHMALGCGMGAFSKAVTSGNDDNIGSSCSSGAGGAFVGELSAEIYKEISPIDLSDVDQWRVNGASFAEIMSIMAVDLAGGDYQIAGLTGRNAAENNALSFVEAFKHLKASAACLGSVDVGGCMLGAAGEAWKEYKENDEAIRDGFIQALTEYADGLAEMPEQLEQLGALIANGEFDKILGAIKQSLSELPENIRDSVESTADSALMYVVTAESREDYIQIGKTMGDLTTQLAEAGVGALTGGVGSGVFKSIKAITKSKIDIDIDLDLAESDFYKDFELDLIRTPEQRKYYEKVDKFGVEVDEAYSLKPMDRGVLIESYLATTDYEDWFNVGELMHGYFPLVDFQRGTNLVSLKTVDTTGTSDWMGRMQLHIDELNYRNAYVGGEPATKMLDLRVQPGGYNDAESLIDYGNAIGVTVNIKEL